MSATAIKPKANWKRMTHPLGGDWFTWGNCSVHVAREPLGKNGEMMWHLSISCPNRYPTWDEIKAARYDLLPTELTFALILPPPSQYVNIHDNCFHLHEIEGE